MILALKNILFTLVVPGTVGVYLPLMFARGRNGLQVFPARHHILRDWRGHLLLVRIRFRLIRESTRSNRCAEKVGPARPVSLLAKSHVCRCAHRDLQLGDSLSEHRGAEYGIIVAGCFYSFVVFFEEPILKKRFGIEYEQYCAEVPRWLFI